MCSFNPPSFGGLEDIVLASTPLCGRSDTMSLRSRPAGRPDQCHDASLDRFRQGRPLVDDGLQIVWDFGFTAGDLLAIGRNRPFSPRISGMTDRLWIS